MKTSYWFLTLSLITVLIGCTYEKDVGASERGELRRYVERAFEIEQKMTTQLGEKMEAEPVVWDAVAEAEATPRQIIGAYERYFSSALPDVSEALTEFNAMTPPDSASEFHQSTISALSGYKQVMESGVAVLRRGDYRAMVEVFTTMEAADAAMESARQELDKLLEITD